MMNAGIVAEPMVTPEPAIGPFWIARLVIPVTLVSSTSRDSDWGATWRMPPRK